jgi:hypothetical protein
MFMSDTLTLDAPRRTQDGYMAVRAKAARTGVYQYSGREVDPDNQHGLRDKALVNVLRDAEHVFDHRAAHSFIGKPITDNHPHEAVTAANWKDYARGTVMGAMREGDHLAFDLLLTDASAIAAVEAGKRELSNGYGTKLEFGDFTAADGTKCPARQTNIVGNHIALVDRGRAGPECRIVDAVTCDAAPQTLLDSLKTEKPVKTMLIDGLTVDIANAETAEATIKTLLTQRDAATGKVSGLETSVATKDARIVTLEAENQTLKDSKPTPAQLREAAKAFSIVCDRARAVGITVTDAMDEAAIRKAVVDAKMGATAASYTADQIAVAFDVLTKEVDPLRTAIAGQPVNFGDAATREHTALSKANDHNAWRNAGGNA